MTITESHGSCAAWAPVYDIPSWREDAACRGLDPQEAFRIFFPTDVPKGRGRQRMYDEARSYCDGCPVVEDCLDEAILFNDRDGFRAGLSAVMRIRMRGGIERWGPCHECGTTFQLRTRQSRYCTPRCANRIHARRGRAARGVS